MYFYLLVATANFASTYCQYDALRFVGFTTQALAKCAKMVPVLLIGRLFYKKSYKEKEYVGFFFCRLSVFPSPRWTSLLSTFRSIVGRQTLAKPILNMMILHLRRSQAPLSSSVVSSISPPAPRP
jgi:hypothetical protein